MRAFRLTATLWGTQGMLRSPGPVAASDWDTPRVVLGTPGQAGCHDLQGGVYNLKYPSTPSGFAGEKKSYFDRLL